MRHASANYASSYWLATVALCIGVLPAGTAFAQQDQSPPTAFIVPPVMSLQVGLI